MRLIDLRVSKAACAGASSVAHRASPFMLGECEPTDNREFRTMIPPSVPTGVLLATAATPVQ